METFLLSIAGAIIVILLGVNGYFMKRWIDSTDLLTDSVNALKTTVALLQSNQGSSDRICAATHKVIETRLNDHASRLNEHGEAIAKLEGGQKRTRVKRPISQEES